MKRFILLAIVLILIFPVSCASSENIADGEFDVDYATAGGSPTGSDLAGFECYIRFYDHYASDDTTLFGYRQDTEFNDAVRKRIKDIESEYNCRIRTANGSGRDIDGNFSAIIIAGAKFSDIIVCSSWNLRQLVEGGVFEPLSQVSDIINYHDSGKWGNWRLLEQVVWDGNIYGVVPVQWPGVAMTGGWMFIFNEKMAGLLAQPDPREFIEDGSWSREKLGEMMLAYTTDDLGHPLKALLTYEGHFFDTALRANNAQSYKLVDGQYISGYHTPEGYDALKWADDFLHKDYSDCTYQPVPGDDYRNAILINEDVAMFLTWVTNTFGPNSEIPYHIENYCVLPMPNGPERIKQNAPYTTAFEYVHATTVFPRNGDVESSAFIANELFEALDGFSEEELKEYYLRNFFHDERDYDLVREVFENSRYTFLSDGIRANVVEVMYGNHSKSVQAILEATEEKQNEIVQKYIVPTVDSLEEIFGSDALNK